MKQYSQLQVLRACAVAAAISFTLLAAFAPFHETGAAVFLSPLIGVALAALYLAFAFRKRWSWDWVFYYSAVAVVINLAFLPTADHYGRYLVTAYVLNAMEVTSCAAIFLLMLNRNTKEQFLIGPPKDAQ